MTFGGHFLRQLRSVKAAFAKTFSPPGSVQSSYRDQLSMGGIRLCSDEMAMFLMLLTNIKLH